MLVRKVFPNFSLSIFDHRFQAVIFVLVCVSIIALLILIGVIFLSANITVFN